MVRGLQPLFPFYQPHERTCGPTAILSNPCREGTIHLQTSVSSPGFEPRPNGTEVSVANHYTGWVTEITLILFMTCLLQQVLLKRASEGVFISVAF
ncbi:hypothetical protein TNCV_2840101 [Trichonephila clavipes]|uniref:Uncharacterized protein n=1 Tax=Trichonephila clavipes TaxID=2585209 RepID=A0A8X6RNJ0_TRICX|nr:hypothetical protein TNCV_2840101 [Trichonephila clavipes]